MNREMFTRAEVALILRDAMVDNTRAASISLRSCGEREASYVMKRISERMETDDELMASLFEGAEKRVGITPMLVMPAGEAEPG